MSAAPIPTLILHGSPFERGHQHGSACAAGIRHALSRSKAAWSRDAYDTARGRAIQSWALLDDRAPEIVQELQGMAEGSSCDVMDLYLRIGFEFFSMPSPTGCSGIAIAAPDGAIIGQNWDAQTEDARELALFLHTSEHGVERAFVASVGTLGWVGCNRHGLALLTNDLMLDAMPHGLPSQVVRRLVLEQPTVSAAIATLRSLPNMAGRCYLLGDATGAVAGIEISPSVGVREMAMASVIFHTNHARLPETTAVEDEARLQAIYPSSRQRLDVLSRVSGDARTVTDVMRILRDRGGAPNAISKSPSEEEETETAFSIIFECATGKFHLCAGPPSAGAYAPFSL